MEVHLSSTHQSYGRGIQWPHALYHLDWLLRSLVNEPVVLLEVDDVVERLFAQVARVRLVRPQVIRHAHRQVNSFLVSLQRGLVHKRPSALIARMLRVKYAGLWGKSLRMLSPFSHL